MTRFVTGGVLTLTLLTAPAGLASAQEPETRLGVTAPAPAPPAPALRLEPTLPPEQIRPREQDFYPGPVQSEHAPAFVEPFVVTKPASRTSAVRVGVSGWTAPAVPFDIPQATGGVAFGITVEWGVPVAGAPSPTGGAATGEK
jgi:hypothetical protein